MKLVSLGGILFLVCAIASGALSLVYKNTKPKIDSNIEQTKKEYREKVLPQALEFEEIKPDKLYKGYDKNKNLVGYIVMVEPTGYGGPISMLIGFNRDNTVSGLEIIRQSETPGLGTKVEDKNFLEQFINLDFEKINLKKDSPSGKIDAISGATISSRAAVKGVRDALKIVTDFQMISPEDISPFSNGEFISSGKSANREVEVKVFVDRGKITKIEILNKYEPRTNTWSNILNNIIPQILQFQSVEKIDNTAEFNNVTKAFLDAVSHALKNSEEKKR